MGPARRRLCSRKVLVDPIQPVFGGIGLVGLAGYEVGSELSMAGVLCGAK